MRVRNAPSTVIRSSWANFFMYVVEKLDPVLKRADEFGVGDCVSISTLHSQLYRNKPTRDNASPNGQLGALMVPLCPLEVQPPYIALSMFNACVQLNVRAHYIHIISGRIFRHILHMNLQSKYLSTHSAIGVRKHRHAPTHPISGSVHKSQKSAQLFANSCSRNPTIIISHLQA
jgi:hypothetical protein